MKKIFIITFCIFFVLTGIICALNKLDYLYPINDKNGGGYINKEGVVIIEQDYGFAFKFEGNYAIVIDKNSKYGVIDKKGQAVVDFKYDELKNLSDDFVSFKKDNKWGFIDILNNIESDATYDDTKPFKEGLAGVKVNNKWGFINKNGKYVIEPKYFDVSNFSEGLASVSDTYHQTSGYINKNGEVVISFEDNALEPKEFKEGLAPIIKSDEKSCSYINKKGKIVIDSKKIAPINIYCGNFNEGLTVFYIDDNPKRITTGFINKRGKIKYSKTFDVPNNYSEGEFSVFDDFNSGIAQMNIDYSTGYINRRFKIIIPIIYEFARDFEDDLAYVKFENREGYINKKNEWVWFKEREGM